MKEYEFTKWPKTTRLIGSEYVKPIQMVITQKMDGTNATIIFKNCDSWGLITHVFSRNRELSIDKDNFGFCEWVENNKERLYDLMGDGIHRGEWCGPGIQTSEGLSERKLFMFNPFKYDKGPDNKDILDVCPLMYEGDFNLNEIYKALKDLESNGSRVNGFNKPEGIIISMSGVNYKVYCGQADSILNLNALEK